MGNDCDLPAEQEDPGGRMSHVRDLLPAIRIRSRILSSDEMRRFLLAYNRRFLPIFSGVLYVSMAVLWAFI